MDLRIGLWRKLSAEELMFLNCDVGEDSWESLELQGDPSSPFWRRSVLGVHWKDWCWSWNSNTLYSWCKELIIWKDPDAGKDWGQEKGTTDDEMVGWHHQLNGHGFGWTPGVSDGQGGLACCGSWGRKVSDTIQEWLNWSELNTVKGFGVVDKAEVDFFLELSCFFYDPVDVGSLISGSSEEPGRLQSMGSQRVGHDWATSFRSGSSAFSKSSLNIWKFMVQVLL